MGIGLFALGGYTYINTDVLKVRVLGLLLLILIALGVAAIVVSIIRKISQYLRSRRR